MTSSRWRSVAICGFLAFATGCGGSSEDTPDVSAAKVKEETREALDAASDYAAVQRRQLRERAQETLGELQRELSKARQGLAGLPDEARERLDAAIDRADEAQERVETQLEQLEKAGEGRWETTRERLSNALDEIEEARREITAALAGEERKADAS